MKLRPIDDRVIVKAQVASTKSPGGLVIPSFSNDTEKTVRGVVVAHGAGVRQKDGSIRPLDISVGDTVVFEKTLGSEIKDSGETYIVVREPNILFAISK